MHVDCWHGEYKRGSHTVWDCKYHIVWVTKYRYQVLGGDVGVRCRELVRETARGHAMLIHAGSVNRDHVHLLLSIPPNLSVSRALQHLKGRSSHKLLSEFKSRRKRYRGQHLWTRGYWAATSGNVTDEVWFEYIKNQTPPEPDDSFDVL
jgi:putative transposase